MIFQPKSMGKILFALGVAARTFRGREAFFTELDGSKLRLHPVVEFGVVLKKDLRPSSLRAAGSERSAES